jgi:hypothetical protein
MKSGVTSREKPDIISKWLIETTVVWIRFS